MYSTAFITLSDTLTSDITLDSVKKIIPRGYYVLTEQGARLSVKAKIDAHFWQAKWQITDDQLQKRNGDLLLVTLDRNRYRDQNAKDSEVIRLQKKQLFWAHFWKYTLLAGAGLLTGKLIQQSL